MIKKDVKIYIGNTADTTKNNLTPCGISSFTPYIMWEIPNDVAQVRFNIKITNIATGAYLLGAETLGDQKEFQWPLGLAMNNNWLGLCHIEIVFSDNNKIGTDMDYTSGDVTDGDSGFFILDNTIETLNSQNPVAYLWEKSFDQNTNQTLLYHLQVATNPLFHDNTVLINDTNVPGVTSGYVVYNGYRLDDGYYFYRVRAFDGYDYSDWSIIHCFLIRSFEPPVLTNLTAYDTENEYGDFIINFDLYNSGADYTTVIIQYAPENDVLNKKPCSLMNSTHLLPNGNNTVTWRTSEDIVQLSGKYWIYATPYSNDMYGDEQMVLVYIDNERFSSGGSGVSSITISFINNYYMVYKRESDDVDESFPLLYQMTSKELPVDYIGWNSNLWEQIHIDSSLIDSSKTEDYEYYVNFRNIYPQDTDKYNTENNVFNNVKYDDIKDFSIYLDSRSFLQKDDGQYIIKDSSDSISGDDWVWGGSTGTGNTDQVTIRPSYQKPPAYNPKFVETSPDVKTNENIVDPKYSVYNYAEYKRDDDGKERLYYYYRWGGELKGTLGSYNGNSNFTNGYGQRTYIDGECVFEDNETESPEYTLYPDVICKNGYPPFIDERYWDDINLQDLYIRKYYFDKGHALPGQYGYKNFITEKIVGKFHRFFSDKEIPNILLVNGNDIYDEKNNLLYENNIKVTNLFPDLPENIKITDENIVDENNNNLYFQVYQRKYINIRGSQPTIVYPEEGSDDEIKLNGAGFSNVAVPKYEKATNVVFSANQFNGRKQAYDLDIQLTRDKRRYVLGHYYDWSNRITDEKLLKELNNWFTTNYPNFNAVENSSRLFAYKYKYLEDGDRKIQEKNCIYIPFEINGNREYFWFEDNSSIFNVDWSKIDDDDYVSIVRDDIAPYIIGANSIQTNAQYDATFEGSSLGYELLKKQNYYSDKSSYGITDITIDGDTSDLFYEYYSGSSEQDFISTPRAITLNDTNVISNSLVLYYFVGEDKIIINRSSYSFNQSSSGYNASFILYQDEKYYDKEIHYDYQYYITSNEITEELVSGSDIIFTSTNSRIIIPHDLIISDTFVLTIDNNIVDDRYYKISDNGYISYIDLNYYMLNRNIIINYNYHTESGLIDKSFVFNPDFTYKIDDNIIENTLYVYYIDENDYYHEVKSYNDNHAPVYSASNYVISLNLNSNYSKANNKPLKITYNIENNLNNSQNINFNNIFGNIFDEQVDVSTIQLFYIDSNDEKQIVSNTLYKVAINGIIIDNTLPEYIGVYHSNVTLVLQDVEDYLLQNLLVNKLYVEYYNSFGIQEQDFVFFVSSIEIGNMDITNYDLYQNGLLVSRNFYNIINGFIELNISEGLYLLVQFLFNQLELRYSYKELESITKTTEDFCYIFNNIDDQILLNSNINDIIFYYIDDNHEIITLDNSLFDLSNKSNGIIKLNSSSTNLLNKKILIDYSYNLYNTLTTNNIVIFINRNQELTIDNNIISNINFYIIEEKNFNFIFNEYNESFNYDDISAYDFELSYIDNGTEIYIDSSDYTIDNSNNTITLDNDEFYNIEIKISYKINNNLLSNNFDINGNKIKLSQTGIDNNLLNREIYLTYTYIATTNVNRISNMVFNSFNSYSFAIDNNAIMESLKIFYADIQMNILEYCSFDYDTGILTVIDDEIKENILNKNIHSNYKTYSDDNSYSEKIMFSNVSSNIPLSKTNIIVDTVTYSFEKNVDDSKYNELSTEDFIITSDNKSSNIILSNRFINKKFDATYQYYIRENEIEEFESNTSSIIYLTKYPIEDNSIKLSYLAFNDNYYAIPIDDYTVTDNGSNIQIEFVNNFNIYNGRSIKVTYISYNESELIEQNNSFENIVFYDNSSSYTIHKGNVLSNTLKIFVFDNNEYQEIDLKYFNISYGNDSTIIRLNNKESINFILNKSLKITYKYNTISEIQQYSFINDRSLTFTAINKPITLSHNYIIEDTFNIYYYDSNNNRILVPKDYYILWVGNDFTYGNVRLNSKNNNSKNLLGKKLEISYRYLENVKKIYGKNNERFPDLDFIHYYVNNDNKKEYYSAYPHSEHEGYWVRKDAIWDGDRGFGLTFSITEAYEFAELQFVYLQQFWDAYNTIHWEGNLSNTTKIYLQYGIVNEKGVVNDSDWHDFITTNSIFNNDLYLYLIPPLTWSVYVDTFDESVFLQNVTYMLRLRLYDESTKTFTSEFINSSKFMIDHDAVNPVNIVNIEYNAWTRLLAIDFRIDDTQGDLYDLTSMYFSQDGRTWNTIEMDDIKGQTTYLTSNKVNPKDLIIHRIYWNTNNYSLPAGTSYRIKIDATYTKFNQGDKPYFTWICTKNPEIDFYERKILQLEGGKQYYVYNENRFETIVDENGLTEYVELDNPVGTWDRVKPYEYSYEIEKTDENGNIVTDENGNIIYETITETRDYIITNGSIKDKEDKIQEIKDRPYKTIINNGVSQSIAWGIQEYYNESGVLIDRVGYNTWMNGYDEVYNAKRIDLITNLNSEIEIDKTNLLLYRKKLLECEIENRRSLIKQGYYNNGFENNVYDANNPIPYKFRVIDSPSSGTVEDADMSDDITDLYIVYYNFQMDFYSTYNSQGKNLPLRDEFYTYNEDSDSTERIRAGKSVSNASHVKVDDESYSNTDPEGTPEREDNRYYGDYNMPKDKYPGKITTDILPSNYDSWTTEYFWRLRPYNLFTSNKKEISRSLIKSILEDGNNLRIVFDGIGHEDLGTVYLLHWDYYGYVVYVSKNKSNDIKLANPSENDISLTNYSGYTVNFPTDRLRDSDGYVIDNDNFKNWISFNPNKIRPVCVLFDNDYYLYYYKPSVHGNKLIYCAMSKNGQEYGEYSQCFPYNPDDIVTDSCNYDQFLDPFVLRINNSFYMWSSAVEITDFDGNKNVVCFQKSDYTGDNWGKPVTCYGLDDCYYPSIVYEEKEREIVKDNRLVVEKYNDYILCALNNQNIVFYGSAGNEQSWEPKNIILNKNNLKIKDFSYDYNSINYGTPFLYMDVFENIKTYYLYFSVYDTNGNSNIYRTKSTDLTNWDEAELIVENAFNPSVLSDVYYGNKVQRLYYNSTINSKLNGKDVQKIIVKTVIITTKRTWNYYNNVVASSCNLGSIPTSNTGIENSISISKNSIGQYNLDELEIRFVFLNTNSSKQYHRYGNWLSYSDAETFGYTINPDNKFKYLDV